jgi:hypothetical protein
MKPFEGTISEITTLWKPKTYVSCPYCESCILPGYMNVVKHYLECPKNPKLMKIHETRSPLIDEIKKNIKF